MKRPYAIFTSIILMIFMPFAHAQEPANLGTLKQQVRQYVDKGEYLENVDMVANYAKQYLKRRIKENAASTKPKKLAIVLDIDETAITNYKVLKQLNFGCEQKIFSLGAKQKAQALDPLLRLYQFALKNNVTVFFVTGRQEMYRDLTETNLRHAGYTHWTTLYMRPDDDKQNSVVPYKTTARKKITRRGYDIVLNIGDQTSDLIGGYADKTYKLPNPFYHIR